MKRLGSALGPIDHFLAGFACLLAVYSVGMSLGKTQLTTFFVVGVLITGVSGFFVSRRLTGSPVKAYDSYLWSILGVAVTIFVIPLNRLLPEEGFPRELIAAGTLSWLLLVGNLFAWRDQTILFLTLPCIAIFGLVGTFDTFKPATILFFLFMLCIALLYARVHQRTMIERAERAGYDEPELLRRGPWKWMAGPEWALASALVVILFSFLGAPVLRGSLKNVAGQISVALPQSTLRQQGNFVRRESDVRIGLGPVSLTDKVVMQVKLDVPRYLRLNSFSKYTGSGWSHSSISLPEDSPFVMREPGSAVPDFGPNGGIAVWPNQPLPPQEPITDGKVIEFDVKGFDASYASIIAPGPVVEVMGSPDEFSFHEQGWVNIKKPLEQDRLLQSYVLVPTMSPSSKKAKLPETYASFSDVFYDKENIPARVRDLAYNASKDKVTDYKKIAALRKAIEDRVLYNTKAAATPRGKDPVDYFLFETKEGYCDVFASSMALMARSIGFPSRYTIGYIVNEPLADEKGFYTVRDRDYHAWCEVYFEGIGWIPIDPTSGAQSVDGAARGSSEQAKPWYKTPTFIAAISGVVVLAGAAPFLFAYWNKQRTRPLSREEAIGEIARLHAVFARSLEKVTGRPKRFSQTTREYVDALSMSLADHYSVANSVTHRFEVAMFSPAVPERDAIKKLGDDIAALRSALLKSLRQKP